jgi:hypothetical protein
MATSGNLSQYSWQYIVVYRNSRPPSKIRKPLSLWHYLALDSLGCFIYGRIVGREFWVQEFSASPGRESRNFLAENLQDSLQLSAHIPRDSCWNSHTWKGVSKACMLKISSALESVWPKISPQMWAIVTKRCSSLRAFWIYSQCIFKKEIAVRNAEILPGGSQGKALRALLHMQRNEPADSGAQELIWCGRRRGIEWYLARPRRCSRYQECRKILQRLTLRWLKLV